jgi:hypothetical protein
MNMKTILASEIGSWLFCARAWWYQRQGLESSNQGGMNTGSELHRRHGQAVLASSLTRALGLLALLAALSLLVAFCTAHYF